MCELEKRPSSWEDVAAAALACPVMAAGSQPPPPLGRGSSQDPYFTDEETKTKEVLAQSHMASE